MAGIGVVSPHKISVLQQTNTNERREIIILRKPILPKDDILITNNRKKQKGKEVKAAPQPIAVARRNARERNRVKQVNNGFANLRQHIPNFIAAAFENNTRGGNKKLSKVETLRMAVEYIRSLEDLLSEETNESGISNSSISSFSSPSPSTATYHDDDATPPPQYTYQIIPNHLYDDSENLEPLNVDEHILADPSLMDADLDFKGVQDLSLLNNMHPSDSLSPGMYSERSLSPGGSDQRGYETVFGGDIKSEDVPVISLKTENELPHQHKSNVMDVMQWWEQHQSPHTTIS